MRTDPRTHHGSERMRWYDVKVCAGLMMPEQDYGVLSAACIFDIFGPDPNVPDAAFGLLADIAGLKRNR